MAKKTIDKSQSFQFSGKHFLIGLGIIVLLLLYFAYGRQGLFLNSNTVPTPTITIPSPTDTPIPPDATTPQRIYYVPQPTSVPIPTSTPVPQKVPVMSYYGNVMYCDPSGVDIVKQAVQNTQSAENSSNGCEDSVRASFNSCNSICATTNSGQSCYDNCTSTDKSGLDSCDVQFTNALNTYKSVASQYCN